MNLKKWFFENVCYVDIKVNCKEELFQLMSNEFLKNNYVKSEYFSELTKRENLFPTGLRLKENVNIAIPHTNSKFVNQNLIVPCILKKPIEFIHMATNDQKIEVDLIFFILVKDDHIQIDVLNKILEIASNQSNYQKFKKTTTNKDFYNALLKVFT